MVMNILKKYSVFILLVIAILITPIWTIITSAQTPNTLQTQVIE